MSQAKMPAFPERVIDDQELRQLIGYPPQAGRKAGAAG